MLSKELEIKLNEAFAEARTQRHEFMTIEHLLLAILDAPKVAEVLRSCAADVDALRTGSPADSSASLEMPCDR